MHAADVSAGRRRHTRSTPEAVFYVLQLGGAGLGFVLWSALSATASEQFQTIPIKSFSIGTTLSLVLTLGLPYLLPNYFREVAPEDRRGRGAWSPSISLVQILLITVTSLALAGQLVATLSGFDVVEFVSVAVASLAALSIMAAQVARILLNVKLMALSALSNALVPLVWIVGAATGASSAVVAVVVAAVGAAWVVAISLLLRPQALVSRTGVVRKALPSLRRAISLVPHLLAFAALMQGVRLVETLRGSAGGLVAAHQVMLIISSGALFIGAVHAVLSVRLQSASEADYLRGRRRFALSYALLGGSASLGAVVVLVAAEATGIADIPPLSLWQEALLSTVLASVAVYYSLSAVVIRYEQTKRLAACSVVVAVAYFILGTLVVSEDLVDQIVLYAAAMVTMPVLLCALVAVGKTKVSLSHVPWAAIAYGAPVVLVVVGLLG